MFISTVATHADLSGSSTAWNFLAQNSDGLQVLCAVGPEETYNLWVITGAKN